MCGIVGILDPISSIDKDSLFLSLDTMKERGPDNFGYWMSADKGLALGHRRLSTIDLVTGQQPMSNEDKTVQIVANGEFYDYERIRNDLEKAGHVFKTKSDSEILVHLYEEYGNECVTHLRGEFAFILWDEKNKELYAFRDRFGIKPLCYNFDGKRLLIASKAKALFPLGLEARWDLEALYHALSHQYVPPSKTLFHRINQLPPGHYMVYSQGTLSVEKYWDWDLPFDISQTIEFEDCVSRVQRVFDVAVSLRLRADVPVAFHLSGGLDSSSVVCSALRAGLKNPNCFTVCFNDAHYSELDVATEFANHVGATLHAIDGTTEQLLSVLPDALYHSEGLAINGHLPAKYLLSKSVRSAGFKVALTGEGADEVFLGYPHFKLDGSHRTIDELNESNPEAVGVMLPNGARLSTESMKKALGFVPAFMSAKASIGFRLHQLFDKSFKESFASKCPFEQLMTYFPVSEQLAGRANELQSSYLWSKLALTNYILHTLGDGTEMAHSVEGRLPFLDHVLFATLKEIPLELKMTHNIEKAILRSAYANELTDTIVKRRKQPFLAPPILFSQSDRTFELLEDLLATEKVPFFAPERINSLLSRTKSMSRAELVSLDPVLMTILSTTIIQNRFGLS